MRRAAVFALTCMVGWTGIAGVAGALATNAPPTPVLLPGEVQFQPLLTYTVPGPISGLVVGDFNNDGQPDVAAAGYQSKRVTILLGDGSGGFGSILPADPFGKGPFAIATADFDGDDNLDVVVTDPKNNSFAVLLGRGDGTLGQPSVFPADKSPIAVVAGDFDGDGSADVAVASSDGIVAVFFNLGTDPLLFSPPSKFQSRAPFFLATDDFNPDDGLDALDLVTVNQKTIVGGAVGGYDVTLLLGDGLGGFENQPNVSVGQNVQYATVGDFDNDYIPDIAVTNYRSSTGSGPGPAVTVLMSNGDGSFKHVEQAQVTCASLGSGNCSTGPLASADFDNDGNRDLVLATTTTNTLLVFLGTGDGLFAPFGRPIRQSLATTVLVPADLDLDGRVDLLVASGSLLQTYRNVTDKVTPIPPPPTRTPTPTPTFDLTPRTPGLGTPSATPARPNGERCSGALECASLVCAQNRCCDQPCDGVVKRCDLNPPGICLSNFTPAPTGTPIVAHFGSDGGCSTSGAGGSTAGAWAISALPAALWFGRRRGLQRITGRVRRPRH